MAISRNYPHPCPRCGSRWRVRTERTAAGGGYGGDRYRVPVDSGSCSNPHCAMTSREAAAFLEERRVHGWDPSRSQAG